MRTVRTPRRGRPAIWPRLPQGLPTLSPAACGTSCAAALPSRRPPPPAWVTKRMRHGAVPRCHPPRCQTSRKRCASSARWWASSVGHQRPENAPGVTWRAVGRMLPRFHTRECRCATRSEPNSSSRYPPWSIAPTAPSGRVELPRPAPPMRSPPTPARPPAGSRPTGWRCWIKIGEEAFVVEKCPGCFAAVLADASDEQARLRRP
jgi:hypothetical protein